MTKSIITIPAQAYLISVENYFSGSNNITLSINGVQVFSGPVAEDNAANICIIGNGETVSAAASDSTGGNFSIRVFRIRRSRVDIWQGSEVTIRYDNATNGWVETSDMDHECSSYVGQKPIVFKSGSAYVHDDLDNPSRLFGVAHESGVVVVTNLNPGDVKEPMTVSIDSTSPPSYMHFRTERPNIQSSDLVEDEFTTLEGVHYADVMYDRLTSGMSPNDGLRNGDSLRGIDIITTAGWDEPSSGDAVGSIDINYKLSKGHK